MEFWFDFASTYSYVTAMRIEALARQANVTVAWKPFLLGPIFQQQGWNNSPFNIYPVKGAYMWRDMERLCEAEGFAFCRPTQFPRNGLLAARVVCEFESEPWVPEFVRQIYRANFESDLDISNPQVVAECLERAAGQDPQPLLAQAQTDVAKAKLRSQTEQAVAAGIFGAPSFRVGEELFWGNDRLERALAWK